jgi:predicted secreted protein
MRTILPRSAAACVMLCAAMLATAVRADSSPPVQNQLSLSATASTEVTNDLLSITLSTHREGPEAAAVQAQLVQALDAALAEARKHQRSGQVEVSTGNFSLYPRYAPKGGATQWQGVAEMRIEGRDFAAITRLVGRLPTMSVARVGYSLSREAREKAAAEVSAQAIARFRSQAETHAKAFGFGAVSLRAVEVTSNESPQGPMPMFRAAQAGAAMAEAALPVEAGKATVSATVTGSVQMK